MTREPAHKRIFAPRFRRHVFGWRSQPALEQVDSSSGAIGTAVTRAMRRGNRPSVLPVTEAPWAFILGLE